MKDRIFLVADLLMGAAYADQKLSGDETATVRRLLREILGVDLLPMDLAARLDDFKPETLDLTVAGAAFASDSPADKRRLLDLIASVHAVDGEFDIAEDDYVRRVGLAIGLAESSFRDLVAAVIDERNLSQEMQALRVPAVKSKG